MKQRLLIVSQAMSCIPCDASGVTCSVSVARLATAIIITGGFEVSNVHPFMEAQMTCGNCGGQSTNCSIPLKLVIW